MLLKKENIPNILTIFRIILVQVIITLLLIKSQVIVYTVWLSTTKKIAVDLFTIIAASLFIIASLTDAVDGYLARKMDWVSNFGKFWDPLADKILINGTLFCLASPQQNLLPIWIPIILLIRDLIIDGMRIQLMQKNIVLPANLYGKMKTVFLMIGILFLFFMGNPIENVGTLYFWLDQNIIIYIATILSIVSGAIYAWPVLFKKRKETENENI